GYSLSFGGGTAVITDPKQPALVAAEASCGGDVIRLKLNKKMKCSTLAVNGSDFSLSPASTGIISASGIGCNGGFDTDSVQLQLNGFLAPGTYTLNIKNGSDGNTMLDFCDNSIPVNAQVSFTVYPLVPTPMDSLAPVACSPQTLRLVFKKPMLCSSVAPNGSDFVLSGPYPAAISGASASCTGTATTSKEIIVTLAQPLYQAGTFTLQLRTGTDGNTILDECGKETPAGSFVTFTIKDTVNAGFTFDKSYGCTTDTVQFYHPGGNDIFTWNWNLDEGQTSILQNPQGLYQQFNNKNISLAVSNGFCSDTATTMVVLDNFLQAAFAAFEDHCPNEAASFTSTATGQVVDHHWSFGDGSTSSDVSPVHTFGQPNITTPFTVTYTVTDSLGCQSSASKIIRVYSSCYIAVPNAFTPNGDGKNDFLRVLNAVKAEQLEFRVYNRWGQMVFMTNDWKRGWNGTIRNFDQPTGTYVWHLVYTDRQTKERRSMRGTATLIR
ncbi:MAG TPA: gliding motility-associated C-terminal domain-containing protein, partial [Flavisolibacter sp.]